MNKDGKKQQAADTRKQMGADLEVQSTLRSQLARPAVTGRPDPMSGRDIENAKYVGLRPNGGRYEAKPEAERGQWPARLAPGDAGLLHDPAGGVTSRRARRRGERLRSDRSAANSEHWHEEEKRQEVVKPT
jgi:hypothetical protein